MDTVTVKTKQREEGRGSGEGGERMERRRRKRDGEETMKDNRTGSEEGEGSCSRWEGERRR